MGISLKKPMLCCTSTNTIPIVVSIEMKAATRRMPCTTAFFNMPPTAVRRKTARQSSPC